MKSLRPALEAADRWVVDHDLCGPDPYDGLLSPLARPLRGRRSRQAFVQFAKRVPERPRALLKIRPLRMTKAIALLAASLDRAPWLPDATGRADALRSELAQRQEGAWGYEFDVQTRWGFFPAGSPNVIVTAFVLETLADHLAVGARAAVLDWLTQDMAGDDFIRYIPGSDVVIHNASLLGARALMRLDPSHPLIAAALGRTLEAQRPDGLWPYGDEPGLEWVDGFHTAYVLDALLDLSPHGQWSDHLARGAEAYVQRCFDPDGRPRYYAGKSGPVDVHNVATALHVLTRLRRAGLVTASGATSERWLLELQRRDGAFVSRPGMPPYMRWNQAHAHRALAEVCA